MSVRTKQICFAIFTFLVYAIMIPTHPWGLVALILVAGVGFHEYSHLWAAKRMGLATGGFYLVPFMGGVSFVTSSYKRYSQQAFVVIMGPVGGGLLALVCAGGYLLTGLPFLAGAAYWMCLLNLFNLLPLSFLDGGQLMGTIAYSINKTLGMVLYCGSTAIACVVLWHFNPILAVMVIFFGGRSAIQEFQNWQHFQRKEYQLCTYGYLYPPKPLTGKDMFLTIGAWLATSAILWITMGLLPAGSLSSMFHR
jgi:Zn-dependent protease